MNQNEQPPKQASTPTAGEITRQRQARLEAAASTPQKSDTSGWRERYTPKPDHPLQPCDFKKWSRRDSIAIEQACFVLLGYEPPPLPVLMFVQDTYDPRHEPTWDAPPGYDDMLPSLHLSIEHGNISVKRIPEGGYATSHVTLPDLVRWAKSKDYAIAPEIESIIAQTGPDASGGVDLLPASKRNAATGPGWSLKTIVRVPGYRWPLHQFLQAAHDAGKICPKAQDVLDAWKLKPQPGLLVIPSGRHDALKYQLDHGATKTAELKAVQAAIDGLVVYIASG